MTRKIDVVLATTNPGKVREFKRLLGRNSPVRFINNSRVPPIKTGAIETGNTYGRNAALKARAFGDVYQVPAIADDSGLEVRALNNAPGITSARYGGISDGRGRCRHLLRKLKNRKNRRARFVCVLAFYEPRSRRIKFFRGEVNGVIIDAMRGSRGFGYDPLFVPDDPGRAGCPVPGLTFAQLGRKTKDRISHRGRAVRALVTYLKNLDRSNNVI